MSEEHSSYKASLAQVDKAIYLIRGQRVMLDADLAALYGVETKALKRAVKRNNFPHARGDGPRYSNGGDNTLEASAISKSLGRCRS